MKAVLTKLLLWIRLAKRKSSLALTEAPPASRPRPAGWCTVLNGGDGRYYRTLETRDLPAAMHVSSVIARHVPDSALAAACTVAHLPVVNPVLVAKLLAQRPGCPFELLERRYGVN